MIDFHSKIEEANAPLNKAMEIKGCTFKKTKTTEHFVDQDDNFVPYPVGYIRANNYAGFHFYISVQGDVGWLQKKFNQADKVGAYKWAMECKTSALEALESEKEMC